MSSSTDISLSVSGDMSGLISAMKEMMDSVNAAMENVKNAFRGGASAAETLKKGTILAADGTSILAKASDSAARAVGSAGDEIRKSGKAMFEFHATVSKTAQGIRERIDSFAAPFANITVAIHGARRAVQLFAGAWAQASRFENVIVRLAPLVGGLETARRLADELRESAANGTAPFETLAASAGKLASVFKSAEAVRKWTDAFHNISAGLGRDVNELVENFVKSKASGRFEAGFLDMFAAKGVDIWAPVRAAHPDKTAAELRKMAVEGKIAFSEIEAAILSTVSAGGAFAGMAEKISATSGGTWDTLVAKAQIALAKLAEPINAAVTPIIEKIGEAVSAVTPILSKLGSTLGWVVGLFSSLLEGAQNKLGALEGLFAVVAVTATLFSSKVRNAFAAMDPVKSIKGKLSAFRTSLGGFFSSVSTTLSNTLKTARSEINACSAAFRIASARVSAFHGGWLSMILALDKGNLEAKYTAKYIGVGLVKAFMAAKACVGIFAGAFKIAMVAIKSALISSGIGALIVAVGEAFSWVYEKITGTDEASRRLADSMKELAESAEKFKKDVAGITSASELDSVYADKMKESMNALGAFAAKHSMTFGEIAKIEEEYAKTGFFDFSGIEDSGTLKKILDARIAMREQYAKRSAEIAEAAAAKEVADAAARAKELRDLVAAAEKERVSAKMSAAEKIAAIAADVGAADARNVDELLSRYAALSGLTEEERRKADALLDAKKKILAIEEQTSAQERTLERRLELIEAEIEGAEKLAEVRKKALLDDLVSQYLAAGKSAEEAAEAADHFIARQEELERVRKLRSGAEAYDAEAENLEILEARAAGEDGIASSLEREKKLREEIARLTKAGVSDAEARALAERKVAAEEKIAANRSASAAAPTAAKPASSGKDGEEAFYDRRLAKSYEARGYDPEIAKKTAQAMAAWRAERDARRQGARTAASGDAPASAPAAGTVSEKEKVPEPSLSDAAAKPQGGVLDFTAGLAALARSQLEELKAIRKAAETIAKDDSPSAALIG